MCGISLVLLPPRGSSSCVADEPLLRRRGPDLLMTRLVRPASLGGRGVVVVGAVLHIRGEAVAAQPCDAGDWTFAWNGEVYSGIEVRAAAEIAGVPRAVTCPNRWRTGRATPARSRSTWRAPPPRLSYCVLSH